jgi:hypothetical protein
MVGKYKYSRTGHSWWENIGRVGQATDGGKLYLETERPQIVGNIFRVGQATDNGEI